MNRLAQSRLTTATTSGNPCLEIIAGALKGFWLRELSLSLAAATASVFGLGRPAAKGVGPTSPVALLPTATVATIPVGTSTALAWGTTAPTSPASFLRQLALAATIGQRTFLYSDLNEGRKLFVPAGASLVLWNVAATSAAYVDLTIDEEG